VDGGGVLAEVVGGQLPQPRQLAADLRGARDVVIARVGVGHRGFRVDRVALIHTLFHSEAKRPAAGEFTPNPTNKQHTL
jgi:hypothetical protein